MPRKTQGFRGFRVFEADHRLRFVAFSFEIFIGGFNGHPGTKVRKMRNRQYFFRTETRGDEERGLLENPQTLGFPGPCERLTAFCRCGLPVDTWWYCGHCGYCDVTAVSYCGVSLWCHCVYCGDTVVTPWCVTVVSPWCVNVFYHRVLSLWWCCGHYDDTVVTMVPL